VALPFTTRPPGPHGTVLPPAGAPSSLDHSAPPAPWSGPGRARGRCT